MIFPFDYVKSFEDQMKDKRTIHSSKILKYRVRNLLPNDASIKLFYTQHGKKTHESKLLNLYRFDEIAKSEYEGILSNPLYFLQNERNWRMFRFYLMKNGYSQNRPQTDRKGLKNRKASLISNGQKLMAYQFADKTKINYQQPWKYIDNTIQNMQVQTKGTDMKLLIQKSNVNKRKTSLRIQTNDQNNKTINHHNSDSPKIAKSLSTSFIIKNKEKQQNIRKINDNLFTKELEKSNGFRTKFYHKMLESELRVKKINQKHTLERSKIKSLTLLKTQKCQSQKLQHDNSENQMKTHLTQLKKNCLKTVYNRSQSFSKLNINQFVPVTKLKHIKAKQRKQVLKNLLEKRLGIDENPSVAKPLNPQTQSNERKIHVL